MRSSAALASAWYKGLDRLFTGRSSADLTSEAWQRGRRLEEDRIITQLSDLHAAHPEDTVVRLRYAHALQRVVGTSMSPRVEHRLASLRFPETSGSGAVH
jgi:hypothetical protein